MASAAMAADMDSLNESGAITTFTCRLWQSIPTSEVTRHRLDPCLDQCRTRFPTSDAWLTMLSLGSCVDFGQRFDGFSYAASVDCW